ncbi:MAG: phospholipase C, phosphocholine-specific [Alphaproteobacteria bacterium HGW-Alphaproteobacteria-5]|nr:MAG: phospholipase C, phosphocholine-specific [Alphaproteobacteria bacterium HGW-Alphaproteobacteria-5]
MASRRDVLKSSLALGMAGLVPDVIQRAYAITPAPGTTFLDAEHVVILMQENRSFDHMFGTLQGVRGFNDPRSLRQADGSSIFLQRDSSGNGYLPWRMNIKDSCATWMGALPHGRADQIDAWNGGAHNFWIEAKRYKKKEYRDIPGTMGYFSREDLPFYYALADAFTVCDQNYCSIMTSTTPNRLMLWSGGVREDYASHSLFYLRNPQTHPGGLGWTSYGERLQKAGIRWKCYQNQIWCENSLSKEEDDWLGNYGDNPLERFDNYTVSFSSSYRAYVQGVIDEAQANLAKRTDALNHDLALAMPGSSAARRLRHNLAVTAEQRERLQRKRIWGDKSLAKLTPEQQQLRASGLAINSADPDFQSLQTISVDVDGQMQDLLAPKGDIFHQFRADVRSGRLPTVSWLVAPANFSDHPSRPWHGAWYVSEAMKILTENPDVWKKTIFILTYDENDGFFDHAPSFVAADPKRPETGRASAGIDTGAEYCHVDDELNHGVPPEDARSGPVGLGYRVPMIIASPWSRGGWVNSEISDHTSILRFLEIFLERKYGKTVRETNISAWRRTVCGDLVSNFRTFTDQPVKLAFVDQREHRRSVESAREKPLPTGYRVLQGKALENIVEQPGKLEDGLWQESGTRPACALPYELYADGALQPGSGHFQLRLQAATDIFRDRSAGSPFNVYLYGTRTGSQLFEVGGIPNDMTAASYAVRAGDRLEEMIDLSRFAAERYDIAVHGPNGFFRNFSGRKDDLPFAVVCRHRRHESRTSEFLIEIKLSNTGKKVRKLSVKDQGYSDREKSITLKPKSEITLTWDVQDSHGWYDFVISSAGDDLLSWRYAGRVETGLGSVTDPAMAGRTS